MLDSAAEKADLPADADDELPNDDLDSPVEFLWQTNYGLIDYAELPIAMFRAFFDGSGKEEQHRIVMFGGWVATAKKWSEFQKRWNGILRSFGVPYFHMKEFAHSVGAFKRGWKGDEPKRRAFLAELVT